MFPVPFTLSLSLSLCDPKTNTLPTSLKMAVEAQYLHLFSAPLYKNRESMNWPMENATCIYGNQLGPIGPVHNSVAPTTNESGFVLNDNGNPSRKRSRDAFTFLGEDLSSQIYNQMLDVDRLLVQHMVDARAEMSQRRRRFSNQIIAALNESFARQLESKDEEIEQLRKLNWAMEERVKSLAVESNAWRYLAQSHEAAAAALGANLEQVLAGKAAAEAVAARDDAGSCCDGNNSTGDWRRMCRECGSGEPSVLLLPCQHLCLCAACGPVADACPICKCRLTGSVNVNLC